MFFGVLFSRDQEKPQPNATRPIVTKLIFMNSGSYFSNISKRVIVKTGTAGTANTANDVPYIDSKTVNRRGTSKIDLQT